jgi:BASS family bile acid:Na+ symporter
VEGNALVDVGLPVALAIVMAGMGLSLAPADFRRVVEQPRAAAVGTLAQLLLPPAIGFAIAAFFADDPVIAAGILLAAAAPSGTMSNVVTHLARGNLALSITLTTISTLITVVTLPAIFNLGVRTFGSGLGSFELPFLETCGTLVAIVLAPTAAGMLVRAKAPAFAGRAERAVGVFALLLMVALIVGIVVSERELLATALPQVGPAMLAFNLLAVAAGYASGRLGGLHARDTVTVAIEVGIRNSTLAILIALTLLQSPALAIPGAVYGLVMYASAAALIVVGRRQARSATIDTLQRQGAPT